jgi:hypothetical protein
MKLCEIQIGGRYTAKVSGRIVTVRVTQVEKVPSASWSLPARPAWRTRTVIRAVNEATGRLITFYSPQRLRAAARD